MKASISYNRGVTPTQPIEMCPTDSKIFWVRDKNFTSQPRLVSVLTLKAVIVSLFILTR